MKRQKIVTKLSKFRSMPVHPIFGGQKTPFFQSMSVHLLVVVVLMSTLSRACPFTDLHFSFSGAYPFTRTFICTFAPLKSFTKAKVIWQENQQVWINRSILTIFTIKENKFNVRLIFACKQKQRAVFC